MAIATMQPSFCGRRCDPATIAVNLQPTLIRVLIRMKAMNRTKPEPAPKSRSRRDRRELVTGLMSGRDMARAWSLTFPEPQRQQAAWAFVKTAIEEYIVIVSRASAAPIRVTPPAIALGHILDKTVVELARTVGQEVAALPMEQACYQLSATYTALVPSTMRSALGMYYTPPALTDRLLDMAEEAGIDWRTARVLDPACGGGAFLLPVVLRIRKALQDASPKVQLQAITERLCGFEIDPFAAWLTQTWLELALSDLLASCGSRLPEVVQVCDALTQQHDTALYDLVVGNPPYGRISL